MTLRERLKQPNILVAPGVYDGLTANLATQSGFEALYLSGAAVAYTRLGLPDIGLSTASEMADTMALIAERTDLPVIMDADTGFGNALNARRTMQTYERAGAAAIQIEDQTFPKRCGHLTDKSLISSREMADKIAAVADARRRDTLIIARTDAIAVEGFDAATCRAEAYIAAGADALFIEAPRSAVELQKIGDQFAGRVPLIANMVEGGATPVLDAQSLEAMGFDIVIFPGGIVRALTKTAQDYYDSLHKSGSNAPFADRMFDFDGLNEAIGTAEFLSLGEKFDGRS
ncbi:MAG: isocitrate lyase/phosphoenolpyruvate mutase family protein [Betaproteobacteria bacterium]|nr:isocitrate lyase/phosphoenolpyruvate mutase family protein [Betaproteobacteria bacterium]